MATITKTQTSIQSAAIYRVTDKTTHEVFYLVKSDSAPNTYYEVHFDHAAVTWRCNCPATKPCKHERAVNEVLKIRRAEKAAAMGSGAVVAVARMQADEDRKLAQRERNAREDAMMAEMVPEDKRPERTPVSCAICGAMTYSAIEVCGKHF